MRVQLASRLDMLRKVMEEKEELAKLRADPLQVRCAVLCWGWVSG